MSKVENSFDTWIVYIILACDRSLYTGITIDMDRRWREHASSIRGAKYFRGRKPLKIVYQERGHTRSSASKREYEIKALSRKQKEALIAASSIAPV